jgi:hypothetical protein
MKGVLSAPAPGALLKAELGILWVRGRRSILVYIGLLYGLLILLTVSSNQQVGMEPATVSDTFRFSGPGVAVVPFLLGILWALWAWRGEPPSRRGLFFAAPVHRTAHVLVRVTAGWLWLMGCVAAYVLGVAVAVLAHQHMGLDALLRGPHWGWVGVFVSASVVYLLTAPFAIISERPDTAVVLTIVFVALVAPLLHVIGMQSLLDTWLPAYAHLLTATFASSPDQPATQANVFLGAAAVWLAVGAAATTAAASRYVEAG